MKKQSIQLKTQVKNFLLIIMFVIASGLSKSGAGYAQNWAWAKGHAGTDTDYGSRVCNDPSGNTFVAGNFASTTLSVSALTLFNASPGLEDVYVAKYDASGNLLWLNKISGTDNEEVGGICSDANGNVYVTGNYGSQTLSSQAISIGKSTAGSEPDIFVAAFNPTGTALWLKGYGKDGKDAGTDCVYSNAQSALYVTGYFTSDTVAFSTHTITNTSINGDGEIFILKLDATANPIWAVSAGDTTSEDVPFHIGLDASNSFVYISGIFYGAPSTVIGSTTLTNNYFGLNYFLAKCSDTGIFQWAVNGGSNTGDVNQAGLAVDAANNCYISGNYDGTVSISSSTLASSGQKDIFLAKYNPSGTLIWANQVSTGGLDETTGGLATDAGNNIYIGGSFTGNIVTIGTTSFTNTATGYFNDIFVAKYNSAGTFQWATNATGADNETANDITCDPSGNLYITGGYSIAGPTAFGTTTLTAAGMDDGYLAKLTVASTVGLHETNLENYIFVYPNPASDLIDLQTKFTENYDLVIENSLGQIVFQSKNNNGNTQVNVTKFAKGFYSIRIQTEKNSSTKKFIVE